MKIDWRGIIGLYEKNNCYLAEATQFLSQAVQYEIPGLRKQIARQEKSIFDMDKFEGIYLILYQYEFVLAAPCN